MQTQQHFLYKFLKQIYLFYKMVIKQTHWSKQFIHVVIQVYKMDFFNDTPTVCLLCYYCVITW